MHPVHAIQKPIQFAEFPEALAELAPWGPYRAVVQEVVDGDTLRLLVDCGLRSYVFLTVRLMGVDTPEVFSGPPEERERGRTVRDYVRKVAGPGTPCVIQTWKDRQTFGRWLAKVTLWWHDQPTDLGDWLVAEGLAARSGT